MKKMSLIEYVIIGTNSIKLSMGSDTYGIYYVVKVNENIISKSYCKRTARDRFMSLCHSHVDNLLGWF